MANVEGSVVPEKTAEVLFMIVYLLKKRPKVVKKRKRLGVIEVDFMIGKNHKGALLVMTD
jgi:hypothetical protein